MYLPVATIDKLAFGGNGVCRIDGKVCFVPLACPGDEVSLRIDVRKKSYCVASIAEILKPSPFRAAPECSGYGVCGGCSWQHISYPAQMEHKRIILAEALSRGAGVPAGLVDNVLPAPFQYAYRSRFKFKVSVQHGKLCIGFFRQGSHQVEDVVNGCPIAIPAINKLLNSCKLVLQSYPDCKSITQLSVEAGDGGIAIVIHYKGGISPKNRKYLIDRSADFGECSGFFLKEEGKSFSEKLWGSHDICYSLDQLDSERKTLVLTYSPEGFAQVNRLQNIAMLAVVRKLGNFNSNEHLLDLYCGNGNFSLPLATDVASVTGIEGNEYSIRAAEYNRVLNKVANIRFFCDDVASGVDRLVEEGRKFDTVLLDPPRSGANDAVSGIVRLKPNKIVYISCDPSTLARDCGLLSGLGYKVIKSVPIDMFPQTYHIESITLLCLT